MTIIRIPIRTVYDAANNPVGLAEFQTGEAVAVSSGGTSATTVSNARINLEVDEANIRSLFSVSGGGSYNSSSGVITIDATDLTPFAKTVDLTTANVTEVSNLYFTNARADLRVGPAFNQANVATTNASSAFNQANVATVNASSAFDAANTKVVPADLTTANVAELTNLYFTNTRAIAALVGQSVSIGEATITGNLVVLGNVVEFNTETLVVEDKNIVLANGSPTAASANGAGITIDGANATLLYLSDGDKWQFNKSLDVSGSIDATGQITSPFFYSESDATLKEDVKPIDNALDKVLKLFGVRFSWKSNKQKSIGVLAQDVEKIIPEIVSKNINGKKSVSYDSLIPILIEAIKEQQQQINELRKKIK